MARSSLNWLLMMAGLLAIAVLFTAGLLLLFLYPYRPFDLRGWGLLLLLAVPVVLLVELAGEFVFSEVLGKKLIWPVFRIAYGVVAGAFLLLVTWFALRSIEPFLSTWGT